MKEQIQTLISGLENPAVRALAIVVGFFLLAIIVKFVVIRTLIMFTRKTKSTFDDTIIDLVKTPIFYSVLLVGLWYAAVDFQFSDRIDFAVFGIFKTFAVVIWGRAAMKIGSLFLRVLGENTDKVSIVQPATLPLFEITIKLVLIAAITYFALVSWGINVTGWLASAGVVGIAVGFAAKDTIANLFAGIFILTDAPYTLGDFIILDNGERGAVTQIGIRSTRILTRDEIEITIPNAIIANSKIVNETSGPSEKRRVRINVSVAYGSDVDQVKKVLESCIDGIPDIASTPVPSVRFIEMADSGLLFQVRVWVLQPVFKGRVVDKLNTQVYKALNVAGIEIPYPKQDLYIKEMPQAVLAGNGGKPE